MTIFPNFSVHPHITGTICIITLPAGRGHQITGSEVRVFRRFVGKATTANNLARASDPSSPRAALESCEAQVSSVLFDPSHTLNPKCILHQPLQSCLARSLIFAILPVLSCLSPRCVSRSLAENALFLALSLSLSLSFLFFTF